MDNDRKGNNYKHIKLIYRLKLFYYGICKLSEALLNYSCEKLIESLSEKV